MLSRNVDENELDDRIKCFLLVPKYAKNQFGKISKFLCSDKYEIITYEEIYNFFIGIPSPSVKYLDDFISAIVPLKNQFDNEIEEDCKYRFFKAIGKI